MAAKGFRKIDTQYFEALMYADLTRSGYKILLAVIHFTLGYQRDAADISLTTFQKLTNLSRPAVKTAIRDLILRGLMTRVRQGSTDKLAAIYSLNMNSETWTGQVGLPPGGQVGLPSEMSETYPVDAENLPSTGQVPVSVTPPTKEKRKPLKKEKTATFAEYKDQLRERFSDLDFDLELEKFNHYWSEGTRKLQRPKLALLNWLTRARKYKAQETGSGTLKQHPRQLRPRYAYTRPEDY